MAIVRINHRIAHITQQDENYCWACSLAMITGRRTWQDALEVADRVPDHARRRDNGALMLPDVASRALNLYASRTRELNPAMLVAPMRRGAIALGGLYRTGRVFEHFMVISFLEGDTDRPDTMRIGVDDPWANGTRWIGPWTQFYGPNKILLESHWVISRTPMQRN